MSYVIKVGDKLKTREGSDVRIICTDKLGPMPIVGLIKFRGKTEELERAFYPNGDYSVRHEESNLDLILPQPKTKRVAPYLQKTIPSAPWYISTKVLSHMCPELMVQWVTKEECPSYGIWLEHLSVEVPDDK